MTIINRNEQVHNCRRLCYGRVSPVETLYNWWSEVVEARAVNWVQKSL